MPIEKLEPTYNYKEEQTEKLKQLFPEAIKDGKVSFEALKEALGEIDFDDDFEHYGLSWPGKRRAKKAAFTKVEKTLEPVLGEGVNEESTENIFIEGDNLDVLKVLQKSYRGMIKMIYIDPPYNTGNDYIYKDNYGMDRNEYLEASKQIDETGIGLVSNSKSSGRFHTNWLNMMYPRLKLAHELLKDEGVIFISIDDNEASNLRKVCDEIFGEENFIAKYIHKNNSSKNQAALVSISTEYFYCYAKNKDILKENQWRLKKKGAEDIAKLFKRLKKDGLSLDEIESEIKEMYKRPKYAHLSRWNKVDENGVFVDADLSREGGPKDYTIINPDTGKECLVPNRGWGKSKDELLKLQAKNLIWYGSEETPPRMKEYINPDDVSVPDSFWYYDNSVDTRWIKKVFGEIVFDNPKPLEMVRSMIEMVNVSDDEIVMDFFSGSGTTAHALLSLNAEDNANRKFIMVQLPEDLDESFSKASGQAKKTLKNAISYLDKQGKPHVLSEITKERIRFSINAVNKKDQNKNSLGFKVYKLDDTNYNKWEATSVSTIKQLFSEMESHITPLKEEWTREGLLTEVILQQGFPLDSAIQTSKQFTGNEVTLVTSETRSQRLFVCLDDKIEAKTIDALVLSDTDIFICLDSAVSVEEKTRLTDLGVIKTI